MKSLQIIINANQGEQEILISELSEFGAEGFEQTVHQLIAYFNEQEYKEFDIVRLLEPFSFTTTLLEHRNWNEEWENNFEPVVINQFCTIRASFHKPGSLTTHDIIITPKMSFGTGHHATTFMMIQQMEGINFSDKLVFDFGTGTGILSILAEKLGALRIDAIDSDGWSKENAIENITKNKCTRIHIQQTTVIPECHYQIILANINRNVLLENMSQLKLHLQPGGLLLLSGILLSDEKDMLTSCVQHGLFLKQKLERNNWISLLLGNQVN